MSNSNLRELDFSFHWESSQKSRETRLSLPVVMAHYLPWFTINGSAWPLNREDAAGIPALPEIGDLRHWTEPRPGYRRNHLHWPALGRYDSRDPAVIAWQIDAAQSAGIDGFVLNWYGKNSVENVITLHFLAGLERWNQANPDRLFGYQICIDSQCVLPTEGKVPVSLEEDLRYVRDHLVRSGHLRRDGRPVLLCFSYAISVVEWTSTAATVFGEKGVDWLWSHPVSGASTGYLWVRPDGSESDEYAWPDPSDIGANRARETYAQWAAATPPFHYGMAGVWPGFNDTLVTWAWGCPSGSGRLRPRLIAPEGEAGNTYDLMWQIYLEALALPGGNHIPLVQIITWNDHAETTGIEPTRDYGKSYLEQTRMWVNEARRVWSSRSR